MEEKEKFKVQVLNQNGSPYTFALDEVVLCDSYEITEYGVYKFYESVDGSSKLILSTPVKSTILRRLN